ncbi:zinc finger protein 507-like isoform X2 [Conger conger]|uniref:zinc finger protein 507-like isoform X2 n=1 Tax=Conger conger TaxID=82655 RepID=UPI002A5A5184|nr:zinc finger protein 507-like isoform X2 [Conger conger]
METCGGAVLISPSRGQQKEPAVALHTAEDSLIQVIEKLSKIVERQRPRRFSLSGRKRPRSPCGPTTVREVQGGSLKKPKDTEGCRSGKPTQEPPGDVGMELGRSGAAMAGLGPLEQAWFCQERCGTYRCLICSYVCGQQRTLKTHAWKHAGLLSCSYPVFQDTPRPEDAPNPTPRPETMARSLVLTAVPEFVVTAETAVELQVTVETDVGVGGDRGSDILPSSEQVTPHSDLDMAARLSVVVEDLPERGEMPGEPLLRHPDTDACGREEEEEEEQEASVEDEKVLPSRRRTPSESLLLHSLAAEALVSMPMIAANPANPSDRDTGTAVTTPPAPPTPPCPTEPPAREGVAKSPAQAGISLSLLSVIERLRERTNESASDEDILRELWHDAQSPGREQACQHVPRHSPDPENHVTQRRKTRVHCCKQGREKRLANDEMNHRGYEETLATPVPVMETMVTTDGSLEKKAVQETSLSIYRCDACDYTSSSSVGVRNHQRIHSTEKPYRCCTCDFATTNMNSLRSHMRSHTQDHQTVQLLEQYRCALCGYVCSHPPSLKSHMWKHAGDQNYNYEQVNRAIDDAISQSGRALTVPQSASPGSDPWEPACVARDDAEKGVPDRAVAEGPPGASWTPGPHPASGPECCVLFCCCVCGFQSPSKQRLLQHMQGHQGQVVSVILSAPAGH